MDILTNTLALFKEYVASYLGVGAHDKYCLIYI